jgi:drug/metabolite transporter (DMT)-like permease
VPPPSSRFTRHDFGMVLVSLFWGGNFAVSKFALEQVSPFAFSALRFTLASGVMIAMSRQMGTWSPLPRRTLWELIALGVIGNTLYQTTFMTGLRVTSATSSAMIVAFLPVLVALLGALFRIERPSRSMWVGVGLGTTGVAMVVGATGVEWSASSLGGDLLVLFAVLCWAFYTVGIRKVGKGVDPLQLTAVTLAAGAGGLLLVSGPALLRQDWGAVTPKTWGAIGYATFFALVLSYPLYNRAVQGIGSGRTALYNCLTPIVAMLVAWVTLGEVPSALQYGGVALVLAGVWAAVKR